MEFNLDNVKVGGLLEIKSTDILLHKKIWKVVDIEKSVLDPQGEFPCIRITLNRQTNIDKEEIYIEVYPGLDKEILFLLYSFDAYSLEEAETWPPPITITMSGDRNIIFESCDIDTVQSNEDHEGYERISDRGREFTHWEYQSTDEREILQIILEDDLVCTFIGYPLPASSVDLI